MNQTRSFLLIAWLVVAGMLWLEWNKTPEPGAAPTTVTTPVESNTAPTTAPSSALPTAALPAAGDATALPGLAPTASASEHDVQPITLANDMLRLTVDLRGGRIVDSELLQYTEEKKAGSPKVRLLNNARGKYYVADAGLISADGKNPQHDLDARFHTESNAREFKIATGDAAVSVPLLWTDPSSGLTVRRTLTLKRGSYVLELKDQVSNAGATPHRVYPFVSLSRVAPPTPPKHSFMTNPDSFSFVGTAWFTPEGKYEKAPFSDYFDKRPPAGTPAGIWIAMLQHHFATAWVPLENEKQARIETLLGTRDGVPLFSVRSIAPPLDVAPGSSAIHQSRLWVGPKLQKPMGALSSTLDLTADYGKLSFIARPLFWLLSWLHFLLGNWGWAIIAIVVLLKLALYPLSAKQYQSMAKMRAVQPRIEALKERYGDDKQQFQVAMMELYKKEKINPIGGCLPMLIPIPIFLGLYWVLIETVELRHAPWMGWIQNLTAPDPYFILPVLNLAVMYLTQKLSPMPGVDPLQKKMMQFMPLIFGVMMAFFPSGLVLYWVTNGGLGLAQQWWMTKKHGAKSTALAK